MVSRESLFIFVLLIFSLQASSQPCNTLGQNPGTAFPVCGTNVFTQTNVALCGNRDLPSLNCKDSLTDRNPFWYKFTCFRSGTIGFLITPNDLGDDYDWQLYDVTGKSPSDVYKDPKLIVSSNWSGDSGITGSSNAGRALNVCAGYGQPLFSSMPSLIQGHEYLLLISHFTNTQSGYRLSFSGGSGSITDLQEPHVAKVEAQCWGARLVIILNKRLLCKSIAADGSDFTISSPAAEIVKANSASCSRGFDFDTVILTLKNSLPAGPYQLIVRKGSDGNSLSDVCGREILAGEATDFIVQSAIPTPMDSLQPVACAPDKLRLVFKNNIRCSSIARDGSDFVITGPSPVTVSGARGVCDQDGLTQQIEVDLRAPIGLGGTFRIQLKNGTDLNSIIDECGQATPAGSSIAFQLKDTVSAAFSYAIALGCVTDTIDFAHDGRNGITTYKWAMDDGKTSALQNPSAYYTRFGTKQVSLTVSNGFCSDTSAVQIILDNEINAKFTYPEIVCPEENGAFVDASSGKITSWTWDFGNGFRSVAREPGIQSFPVPALTREVKYNVSLVVGNAIGCFDTSTITIKAVSSCYIAVPSAFTPDGDGLNDYLYPLNAFKATDLKFRVFNRYGQVVFETTDWTKKWDGTIKGKAQGAGVYVWTLSYKESDTGKQVSVKGTSSLIR